MSSSVPCNGVPPGICRIDLEDLFFRFILRKCDFSSLSQEAYDGNIVGHSYKTAPIATVRLLSEVLLLPKTHS